MTVFSPSKSQTAATEKVEKLYYVLSTRSFYIDRAELSPSTTQFPPPAFFVCFREKGRRTFAMTDWRSKRRILYKGKRQKEKRHRKETHYRIMVPYDEPNPNFVHWFLLIGEKEGR